MNEVVLKQSDVLNLNKASLKELGESEAVRLLDDGFHDAVELLVFSKKYLEMLGAFNSKLKSGAADVLTQNGGKMDIFSSKVSLGNTGDRLNYKDDPIYAELKAKVDARVELLKVARKQDEPMYDSMGIEVPKVGLTSASMEVVKVTL